jgi:CRISPR-associated protein Cas2
MFVLFTYDVAAKRTEKFRKLLSRYLVHEQNSVFGGDLTQATLLQLHKELQRIMCEHDRMFQVQSSNRHNVTVSILKKSGGNGVLEVIDHNHHKTDATVL